MGKITGICISEKRGTSKHPVDEAVIREGWGIENDAHGGNWHRQISLLSQAESFWRESDRRGNRFFQSPCRDQVPDRGCPSGTDTDWEGMSSALPDLSEDGRLYHAKRRRVFPGGEGRQDPDRG